MEFSIQIPPVSALGLETLAALLCVSDLKSSARVGCFIYTDIKQFLILYDCRERSFSVSEKAAVPQSRSSLWHYRYRTSLKEIMFPINFHLTLSVSVPPALRMAEHTFTFLANFYFLRWFESLIIPDSLSAPIVLAWVFVE